MYGFYIQSHDDEKLLGQVLDSIYRFHPEASTFVLYNRYSPKKIAGDYQQFYVGELPYYSSERAASIPHNWLNWLLPSKVEWLFKIDTDALMIGPLKDLHKDCVMCSVVYGWYPQGGCYGFHRSVAEQLLAASEKVFHSPPPQKVFRPKRRNWVAEDKYFGYLAEMAGIPMKHSDMLHCRSKSEGFVSNHPTASIIHPVELKPKEVLIL